MITKKSLIFIGITVLLVLGVNISANYSVYASGNSWHFSVFFVLSVTALGWITGPLVGKMVQPVFRLKVSSIARFAIIMLLFALQGAFIMFIAMKTVVWVLHTPEPSQQQYTNNITYCVLFTLIIGLLATGDQIFNRLKKANDAREAIEKEMTISRYVALKNQVNPHFLFNSLNTLLVLIPEQPDLAMQFVEQMAKVFRYSLQTEHDNDVNVATELKVVESLLFVNAQRFGSKIKTSINIETEKAPRKIITHSLLMLVENAIKHNEISTTNPLNIDIFTENDMLVVRNNKRQRTLAEPSTGIGLTNIRQRYELAGYNEIMIEENDDTFTVKLPLI